MNKEIKFRVFDGEKEIAKLSTNIDKE